MPDLANWRTGAHISEARTAHPTVVRVEARGIAVVAAARTRQHITKVRSPELTFSGSAERHFTSCPATCRTSKGSSQHSGIEANATKSRAAPPRRACPRRGSNANVRPKNRSYCTCTYSRWQAPALTGFRSKS
jgi:hypothetical protein